MVISLENVINSLKNEVVFIGALILAVGTSFIAIPKVEYIDFKVLFSLFNLMLMVKAFEELKIMDKLAIEILSRYKNSRIVSFILISLTFISSMFITNDVALITFVPLSLIIGKKAGIDIIDTIIFETLAANIGSSLTPMGNPQNLFLFSYYKLYAGEFFKVTTPLVIIGGIWLFIINLKTKNIPLDFQLNSVQVKDKGKAIIYGVLFTIIIMSIFNFIDYKLVSVITIILVFILDKELIVKVDYFLLATFIGFFIFIGNVSNSEAVHLFMKHILQSREKTYFTAISLSQVVSNVPCAILLSGFTENWREILLGVNIGGMGTLIASLASVIAYKLYVSDYPDRSREYLIKFSIHNFISLGIFIIINYFIIF
ncbi:anion transporter [Clostridium bovifaecis]|uniref:Anion transporter n=1 Tax=Clostridium bovifaecis TaxID=2184719 RepID=A0A6I6F0Z4_9CLOT|nr:anion transporter [Clostridium bovifaecis]